MNYLVRGQARAMGATLGVLLSVGVVEKARATDFFSGPAATVTPQQAVAVYAVRGDQRAILAQRSGRPWSSDITGAGGKFNSEISAAVWYSNNLVNGSKEHQVVCDRETSLVAGDPQFDYVNCNISNTYDGDPDRFRAEGSNNWLNGHWRAAPVPVYSGSLASGSGQNIVYSLADNGNIIIGVYGSCTITDPTLDQAGCLSTNYGIVAGAPTDFIALAATGVRDASGGFRVVLCGLHNHQFTCSKSTDLFGTTFGAWTSAPGRYASGPAIARWHSGSADGVASFALSTFDTQLWSTTQVGGTWSNPVSMSGDLMNVASVITLSKQDDPPVLMVFGRAHFSGQMWSTTVTPSGQSNWTPWF